MSDGGASMRTWHDRLWRAERASGPGYRLLSALLVPAEWGFRLGVAARSWGYERGLLPSEPPAVPALGIGNLTVGGTGKTPVAAWFARRLEERGRRAAVVLRGYGGDETAVHRLLNPSVPVITAARRTEGVRQAGRRGAEVAVLDDAFQHRGLRATAQVVLVAAEDWAERPRLLPRGPWREPLKALARADLVVVTRKLTSAEGSRAVQDRLSERQPGVRLARAQIALAGLARYDGATLAEPQLGRSFEARLALAGVAKPEAVRGQLADLGVSIGDWLAYPDHHRYTKRDVARISRAAGRGPLVATLKDAVKLQPLLGPDVELWVPLQRVVWESGEAEVEALLTRLVTE